MSDANDNNDNGQKPAQGGRAPLTLKPRAAGSVQAGTVRQSFSHGRSKTVVVETKRRREGVPPAAPEKPRPAFDVKPQSRPQGQAPATSGAGRDAGGLSQGEMDARRRAIEHARQEHERRDADRQVQDDARHREQQAATAAAAAAAAQARPQPQPPVQAQAQPQPAPQPQTQPQTQAQPQAQPQPQPQPQPAPERAAAETRPEPAPQPAFAHAEASARPAPQAERPAARPAPQAERPAAPQAGYGQRAPRSEPSYGQRAPRPEPSYGQRAPRPDAGRDAGERPPREGAGYGAPRGDRPPREGGGYGAPREGGGGYGAPRGDRPPREGGGGGGGYGAPRGDRPPREGGGGGYGAPRGDRPPREGGGGYGAPRGDRPPREGGGGGYGAPREGGGGYGAPRGDRPPREGGGYGAPRGDRPPREGGGGFRGGPGGDRGPRPGGGGGGETVRYSALAPRPAGPRPGGDRGPRPGGGAGAPSTGPEVARPTRGVPGARPIRRADDREEADSRAKRPGVAPSKAVSRTKGEAKRREGRLTIQAAGGDGDASERMRSLASVRRAREREKEKRRGGVQEQARVAREVIIPDVITVQELSNRMAVRAVDIIKFLMRQGMMLKINDVIDTDTAELVATDFGHTVRRVSEADVEEGFISAEDEGEATLVRPPVVAIMGHVDHGKTSLLDALRSTDVAAGEAGGITQHIGAYQVRLENGERVTFLDTPGHAAFSAMRARGAHVTDIVVLVVAADDGVMPQTVEAINHAKAAHTPIIVAVNKIDKPNADPTRVVNELLQHEIVAESLGGETQIIQVSAMQKLGLDDLVEAILLQAEVLDLRANPDRTAEGVVIEAKLDKGRGPVATVLVKRGTLKRGDIVVAGAAWGRVRALINEREEQVPTAGPSDPVEILGLDSAPEPGEALAVVENEARARELTEYRDRKRRERTTPTSAGVSLSDMMAKLLDKKLKELPVIIKADVQGSAEAISGSLAKLATDEVRARIILSGVGGITESDVLLAKGAGSPIIGFNVRASKQARELAEREGVEIRYYAIIYDLIDDLKGVLSGMLSPIQRETFLGNSLVLEVFDITRVGKVAGCRVTEGVMRRGAKVRIVRADVVIQEMGTLQTLKRFKDDASEVISGQECGMSFANFQDIKAGDLIECFTVEQVARSL